MARHETHRWRMTGALAAACAGLAWGSVRAQPPTVPTPRIVSVQAADEPAPPPKPVPPADQLPPEPPPELIDPAALGGDVMPIDLPTALRLVSANNPTVALARLRYNEALIRQQEADVRVAAQSLSSVTTYNRHDGQIQNAAGLVFQTNKSNLFAGDVVEAQVATADALFLPLVAERPDGRRGRRRAATNNNIQLDVSLAYLELLRAYEALTINGEILSKSEYMLKAADAAVGAGQSSSAADANRVRTEVDLRRQERRVAWRGRLPRRRPVWPACWCCRPGVNLTPAEPKVLPVAAGGFARRPDGDGGGRPDESARSWRGRAGADRGGGTGLVAAGARGRRRCCAAPGRRLRHRRVRRRAGRPGRRLRPPRRRPGAGDVGAAQLRRLRYSPNAGAKDAIRRGGGPRGGGAGGGGGGRDRVGETGPRLDCRRCRVVEDGVQRAEEMWRKLRDAAFEMADRKRFDPIPPVLAVQALAQARYRYLNEVIDYNQAQFRLYTTRWGSRRWRRLNCPPKQP